MNRLCRPLALVLTVGQAGDSPQFVPVLAQVRISLALGRPRTKPGAVAKDKAYSSTRPLPATSPASTSAPQ